MKNHLQIYLSLAITMVIFSTTGTAQKKSNVKGEEITYSDGGTTLKGYIAYDASRKGKRPAIIVVPEWWGNNEYTRMRARMLAELGYIAIAADMYGDGKLAADPKQAQEFATPFYQNPALGKGRIQAAMDKIKEYPQTDDKKIAAIGYCFGGSAVLNAAKMGMDLKGVVSFHGGMPGVPATTGSTKAKILVCHGGADKFETPEEIKHFKHNLDSVKVPYTFKIYPGATHAFTNPEATATGKKFNLPIAYNQVADKRSWQDMKIFLKKTLL